jgi:riboflavin transporter FmnP
MGSLRSKTREGAAMDEDARGYSPKKWAALFILTAMAMVLSFVEFPLFPTAHFLKYDPSSIIAILAALLYGPGTGCAVAVLAWVPRFATDPLGSFMNIMSVLPVVIAMGVLYRKVPSRRNALLGAILGGLAAIAVSVALNFLVMPSFYGASIADVQALLVPALVPFNVAKVVLNCAIALITYRKLENLLAEEDGRSSSGEGDPPDCELRSEER